MTDVIAVLFATLFLLMLLGVPIAYCLIVSSTAAIAYMGEDVRAVGWEMSRAMANFFPFIAVPFFILAGELMNKGGLSQKIIDFSKALTGHRRGGMGMVTVLSSMLFGGISGASSADTAAVGSVMIPAMTRAGYGRPFATALAACAGSTGAMIPPSIVMILCGVIAGLSIEKLFLGGAVPGLMVGCGLMVVSYLHARKHNIPVEPRTSLRDVARSAAASLMAIVLVVIIVGGILGGVFTATEASAVAVVYALLVGLFIYRQLKFRDLPAILVSTARTTGNLSFLICGAVLFARVLAVGHVPQTMTTGLLGFCDWMVSPLEGSLGPGAFFLVKKVAVLLVLNAILLVLGTFLDAGPALIILVPVLMPIAGRIDMDPIHFGVMVVVNLTIGLVTPPVGTTLFVACGIGKIRIGEVVPQVLRILWVLLVVQLLITFVPPITLFLPSFLK